jgi:hypothetical protein
LDRIGKNYFIDCYPPWGECEMDLHELSKEIRGIDGQEKELKNLRGVFDI